MAAWRLITGWAALVAPQVLAQCSGPRSVYQETDLVWSDEFDGNTLDMTKWEHETGNGCPYICGWGNNELQSYTGAQNVKVRKGRLMLRVQRRPTGGMDYASAKIQSKGKFDFTYGRVEARVNLPRVDGLWPAVWMLPSHYNDWPNTGEIDILEAHSQMEKVQGNLHYAQDDADGGHVNAGACDTPAGLLGSAGRSTGWHVYSVEWEPEQIRWYMDGELYCCKDTWTTTDAAEGTIQPVTDGGGATVGAAPFNAPFHIIMNVAVGGNYVPAGIEVADGDLPRTVGVDYVRVYQLDEQRQYTAPVYNPPHQWNLLDDGIVVFDETFDGGSLDPDAWTVGEGQGNQYIGEQNTEYIPGRVRVRSGELRIGAKVGAQPGTYTSGKVATLGLDPAKQLSRRYGRFEVEMKLPPRTQGLRVYVKLVASNCGQPDWPHCGEVSIVEASDTMDDIRGLVFWRAGGQIQDNWDGGLYGECHSDLVKSFAKGFHTYALEWFDKNDELGTPATMTWKVDEEVFCQYNVPDLPFSHVATGDQLSDFHLDINVAVGDQSPDDARLAKLRQLRVRRVRALRA